MKGGLTYCPGPKPHMRTQKGSKKEKNHKSHLLHEIFLILKKKSAFIQIYFMRRWPK